ncbi:MAG TPA: hypothetical protein VHQ21_18925 [Rhodanobacteraceae bacterium]|jgi:hypothetical protein|nr:hypothetical protein [Rhodanobacteraceae bacterium]
MRKLSLAILAGLIVSATNCWADETPQPHPAVPGGRIAAINAGTASRATAVASPTVSQTTVVRMPDGSLGMVCEQKRNPAAAARTNAKLAPEHQQ